MIKLLSPLSQHGRLAAVISKEKFPFMGSFNATHGVP